MSKNLIKTSLSSNILHIIKLSSALFVCGLITVAWHCYSSWKKDKIAVYKSLKNDIWHSKNQNPKCYSLKGRQQKGRQQKGHMENPDNLTLRQKQRTNHKFMRNKSGTHWEQEQRQACRTHGMKKDELTSKAKTHSTTRAGEQKKNTGVNRQRQEVKNEACCTRINLLHKTGNQLN